MRPISRWSHLMSTTVSVAARTCQSGYGTPAYGAATSYRAHLARKRRVVRSQSGQEVMSEQTIYLATADPVAETAQVTLSTADAGSTEDHLVHPVIKAVERRFDQTGPHHVVLYL